MQNPDNSKVNNVGRYVYNRAQAEQQAKARSIEKDWRQRSNKAREMFLQALDEAGMDEDFRKEVSMQIAIEDSDKNTTPVKGNEALACAYKGAMPHGHIALTDDSGNSYGCYVFARFVREEVRISKCTAPASMAASWSDPEPATRGKTHLHPGEGSWLEALCAYLYEWRATMARHVEDKEAADKLLLERKKVEQQHRAAAIDQYMDLYGESCVIHNTISDAWSRCRLWPDNTILNLFHWRVGKDIWGWTDHGPEGVATDGFVRFINDTSYPRMTYVGQQDVKIHRYRFENVDQLLTASEDHGLELCQTIKMPVTGVIEKQVYWLEDPDTGERYCTDDTGAMSESFLVAGDGVVLVDVVVPALWLRKLLKVSIPDVLQITHSRQGA